MKVKFRLGSTETWILFRCSLKAWNNLSELLRILTKKAFQFVRNIVFQLLEKLFYTQFFNNYKDNLNILTLIIFNISLMHGYLYLCITSNEKNSNIWTNQPVKLFFLRIY